MTSAYSCKNPLVLKVNPEENYFDKKSLYEDIDLNCNLIKANSYSNLNDITIEDFITSNVGLPIVTKRAKVLIEKLSIGNTKFIPVEVVGITDKGVKLYAMHKCI